MLDKNTVKIVAHGMFSILTDFNEQEVAAMYEDEKISFAAHALAIEPDRVHYASHFCRNSAVMVYLAMDEVRKVMNELESEYQLHYHDDDAMSHKDYVAQRRILIRLSRQLEKRWHNTTVLAQTEQEAEKFYLNSDGEVQIYDPVK